ncbi:MFS transporter [Enorma massiliensis]|uniref:MFS transporter n=1 Tax=Enorma massiliensis TaxID=1472761 RepID=UPI0002F19126|nr:MFS transporter [Enorma massiliensis]
MNNNQQARAAQPARASQAKTIASAANARPAGNSGAASVVAPGAAESPATAASAPAGATATAAAPATAVAAPAAAPATATARFLILPIIVLILAQMGATGDNGALSLATASLTSELGATTAQIQLANMIYPLVGGAFMIAGGLAGTMVGWKKTFRGGILLCALGEVVLALAPSMAVFIWGGRVLVGLGASFMIPSVLGLIPLIYQGHDRVIAFGAIGAASGLSALLPLALGVVMQVAGMHVTFLALAGYFAIVFAASFTLPAIEQPRERAGFDGVGVALAASGLFLLLIGLSSISSWGLVMPLSTAPFTILGISPALPMAAAGIVVLGILVAYERRVEARGGIAVLPSAFLTTPQVRAGLVACALTFFFMGAQSILMAPYLQLVAGWSPVAVGTISIVTGVPTFALALGIPKFMPQASPRRVIQTGYVAMAAALGIMAFSVTENGASAPLVYLGAFMAGVGAGTVSAHASNVVAMALPEREASQSGGIQSTMRNVGQALGVALLGAVLIFGITGTVRSRAAADASISPRVSSALSGVSIDLVSNRTFEDEIAGIPMTDGERKELVSIEATARLDAVRMAYAVGGAVVLAGLITTPAIRDGERRDPAGSAGSTKAKGGRS